MAWFHPASERLNTLFSQGLGTPNTPAYFSRIHKILKLIQNKNLLHPNTSSTWLSVTPTHDLMHIIRTLPPQALFNLQQQTLLHECPQNEQDFERWWIAFHAFSYSLKTMIDHYGRNALHYALNFETTHPEYARKNAIMHLNRIQALVDSGVDLGCVDNTGKTPMELWVHSFLDPIHFHHEAWHVFKPWVHHILNKEGFKRLMPLFWKEKGFHYLFQESPQAEPLIFEKAIRLLEMGYPVDRVQKGTTLLHQAVFHNLPSLASLILEKGGKSHIKDKKGLTPIQLLKRTHPYEMQQQAWAVLEQDYMNEKIPLAKNEAHIKRL